jgi:ABC-type multidrug transport system fused ATPase/permease subunit
MQFITVIPSFLVYVGLINLSLANLSTQFEAIQLGASYFNHIETILAIPNEKFKSKNLVIPRQQFKGNVEFNNVTFAYGKKNVINNLSFKIQSGQKVAIVGHTGGGKTTITKLLMRFYDPNSGVIKIDGYNISDLNVNYLRSLYAVVSQEA